MSKNQDVKQVEQRAKAVAWWVEKVAEYPAGLVPVSTASRVLAVSPQRVAEMIKNKQLDVVSGMPGECSTDRFIPIVQLIKAPFSLNSGRPGLYGPQNRKNSQLEEKVYEHYNNLCDKHLYNLRGPPKHGK